MSKKLDLNSYLNRYTMNAEVNSKAGHEYNPNEQRNTIHQSKQLSRQNSDYISNSRMTQMKGFQKAQVQAIEHLHEIKEIIKQQERGLSHFIQNYYKRVHENLKKEHDRIKQQLLDMFQRSFRQTERRIEQHIRSYQNQEPKEFIGIKNRFSQISAKIEKLEMGLKGDNYKQSIAEVVTNDFEREIADIQAKIAAIQKSYVQQHVKIEVDQTSRKTIEKELENFISVQDLSVRANTKPKAVTESAHKNRDFIESGFKFFNFN